MSMSKILVTGGAGFIGSNFTGQLLTAGHQVAVIDNLSLGKKEYLAEWFDHDKFKFYQEDLLDFNKVKEIFKSEPYDLVIHLAANSDIASFKNAEIDLKLGTLATHNVLEAMKEAGLKKILFSSSSVIYGEAKEKPTSEDYGPLLPISFYGANKLAAEGLISAYAHIHQFQAWIFRFANIIGPHGTHGVILDFINKLKQNGRELEILGDGEQCKPYMYVTDCLRGMLLAFERAKDQVNFFNLTSEGRTTVREIAMLVIAGLGLKEVKLRFSGGVRGWPGDVTQVDLSGKKLAALGFKPEYSSSAAVKQAINNLILENH